MKPGEFVELLTDMHYFEAAYEEQVSMSFMHPDSVRSDTVDYYHMILDKHGVDRDIFRHTMEYYSYNPGQFESIYMQVIDELNRRITGAQMEEEEKQDTEPVRP